MKERIFYNLEQINKNIAKICQKYHRNKEDVKLMAVSKTIDEERIKYAIEFGCRDFGENKVMEAKTKWLGLKEAHPEINLHLIGHLQSNKAKVAVSLFDHIHSLDSEKLANILALEMKKQNKYPQIFIQVNIGNESLKTGIKLAHLSEFISYVRNELKIEVSGLMCIPPIEEDASLYFALLKKKADENNVKKLSMGMTGDYESAIATGSNYLRLGTAIFGKRD